MIRFLLGLATGVLLTALASVLLSNTANMTFMHRINLQSVATIVQLYGTLTLAMLHSRRYNELLTRISDLQRQVDKLGADTIH